MYEKKNNNNNKLATTHFALRFGGETRLGGSVVGHFR